MQEYPRSEENCKTTKQTIDEKQYSSIVCVADDEDHMNLKTIVHLTGKLKFSSLTGLRAYSLFHEVQKVLELGNRDFVVEGHKYKDELLLLTI